MTVAERFWAKVPERPDDGCWLWAGAVTGNDYGKLYVDGQFVSAHRIAVELDGRVIAPGRIVMHTCDQPSCVRPDHLVVGTYSDNHRDAVAKGRWGDRRNWREHNGRWKDGKWAKVRR